MLKASLRYYAASHVMVVVGVAVAVGVLAGALLVGDSVRASLRALALGRLGATDVVVSSPTFFRATLADEMATRASQPQQSPLGARLDAYRALRSTAPLVSMGGAVVHDPSRRTAGRVAVYGIDERFGRFHGVEGFTVSGREALITAALARELGAAAGDGVTLRVARPTDIPLSTLQGRRDTTGQRIRLTVARVLDGSPLADFSLEPSQGEVLAIFVPLGRLQRDLGLGERVNTILLGLTGADPVDPAALIRDLVTPAASVDDVGLRVRELASGDAVVESRSGLLTPAQVDGLTEQAVGERRAVVPALTYVANRIRIGDRVVPYSTVTAIDLDAYNTMRGMVGPAERETGDGRRETGSQGAEPRAEGPAPTHPPLWLNEWAAGDLGARAGDEVTLDYFLWSDQEGLSTASATFTLRGIVPMAGIGGDATLTPDYPGISDAADITSWDPPFPVDLALVRKKEEDYWDQYRAAPKAIIPLAEGQRLWGSRYGEVSSLRVGRGGSAFAPVPDAAAAGFAVRDVRGGATAAAQGTTDFGEYFLYFSFFLVVSALLLAYLFFALGLEQRRQEVGLLSSVGFSPAAIRRVFLREGAVLAAAGGVIGAGAAVGYGALIMHGLRTWWVGAVGTTALELHVSPAWLAAGVAGALAAGLAALWLGVRAMERRSARALLLGGKGDGDLFRNGRGKDPRPLFLFAALGLILIVAAMAGLVNSTAAFFAAGGAWLAAGLAAAALLLGAGRASAPPRHGPLALVSLGLRNTSSHPSRAILSLALVAFACFVLVSVGAFRKDAAGAPLDRASGIGGFTLMAESVAPLMHDPNTAEGRDALGFDPAGLPGPTTITRFRLRPGDEASCLTLYRPTNPRIIAPEPRFYDEPRFTFSQSLAATPEEAANPWRLLHRTFEDGAIPAIADQTTLTYALHLGVGDDFVFSPDGRTEVRLRIVAALSDSVLQSELIIGEPAFVALFPREEGYRVWLIEAPPGAMEAVTNELEDRLSDAGLDVTDTNARWASYHAVENTYLATFQALGALGLLLGTVGLGAVLARNVLERRREIGLLGAVGFTPANVRTLVLSESVALVLGGVLLGTASATVAILPALRERAQAAPVTDLAGVLAAVVAMGLLAALFAVRLATLTPVVRAIKSE